MNSEFNLSSIENTENLNDQNQELEESQYNEFPIEESEDNFESTEADRFSIDRRRKILTLQFYLNEFPVKLKGFKELDFEIFYVNGHTEKMMLPKLQYQNKTIVFCADLIPTAGHLPLPYVMGYDTRPLLTMPEKLLFLNHKNPK